MSRQEFENRVGSTRTQADQSEEPTSPQGETVLELDHLTREFADETAVDSISLSVEEGELVTLLGPSGCGKTTVLRMIAGLEEPTAGRISLGGTTVADDDRYVTPENRDVGLVFQDFALFPHLTVAENITFGVSEWPDERRQARLAELLELVDLEDHRDKFPDALSGGQRQRVALARSLAPEPAILLLDEPFSNLDVRLRLDMREEVRRILKEAEVTTISVTHDQEEALSISDRVVIMNEGHLEQAGKPEIVFENPESRFVASFLGRASFVPGRVRGDRVETGLGTLETAQLNGPVSAYDGAQIDLLVRPHDLEAIPANEANADGRIVHRQYNGPNFIYRVELSSGTTVRCLHNHVETFDYDQPVTISIAADHQLAWYPAH